MFDIVLPSHVLPSSRIAETAADPAFRDEPLPVKATKRDVALTDRV
jgi:hypothetical protein